MINPDPAYLLAAVRRLIESLEKRNPSVDTPEFHLLENLKAAEEHFKKAYDEDGPSVE
jgi:hypothetical protein